MNAKPHWPPPYKLAIAAAALLVVALAVWRGWEWRHNRQFFEPASLLSRFPVEDSAVLSVDFNLVRKAGFLAESKMAAEPEYRQFLEATGFDYRRDLQQLTAAFSKSGSFFIARGHFDWAKLRAYAVKQGGSCYQALCRMQGSAPERHISFLPLRDDALALAVSTDDLAAARMANEGPRVTASLPSAPVWLSFPGAVLKQPGIVPAGLRVALSALTTSDRVVITVEPSGTQMAAKLEATCRSVEDARVLASQLRVTTADLKKLTGDDLARGLGAGSFEQSERRVTGRWPLSRSALDLLASAI